MSCWFKHIVEGNAAVIAGPCAAESEQQIMLCASALKQVGIKIFRAGVWKPRTMPGGFEGVGRPALKWLKNVQQELDMKVATEVANAKHVQYVLEEGVDIIWVGARTSTNPFAVQEIAEALKGVDIPVLVKNPMVPDVKLWRGAIERFANVGITKIAAVHRGFGGFEETVLRNAPLWRVPIELHRQLPDIPMICDPSHIAGKAELVAAIAMGATDLGFDALMIESHINPQEALSDAAQQLTPAQLQNLLQQLRVERAPLKQSDELITLRSEIDELDTELFDVLSKRMNVVRKMGKLKAKEGCSVLQTNRYDDILKRRMARAEQLGLSPEFVRHILEIIHEASVAEQIAGNKSR